MLRAIQMPHDEHAHGERPLGNGFSWAPARHGYFE